jgi:hypothetical protein
MRLLRAVADFGSRHPVLFGCGVSSVKTSGADFFAQRVVEKKKFDEVDWRRNSIFFCWGLFYLGGVQYFIYVKLFAKYLFPNAAKFVAKPWREKLADRAGQAVVVQQVALDQLIHHPFMLFPCLYQVKEFMEGGTPQDGFRKYRKNLWEDCQVLWLIWVPTFFVNFSLFPLWMRVPCVAVVSMLYTTIVSTMRGAPEALPDAVTE